MINDKKKIAYEVAVEQFGPEWAETHVASGQVEPSMDQKKYGSHYEYVLEARAAVAVIAAKMNTVDLPGAFRVQLVGVEPQAGE